MCYALYIGTDQQLTVETPADADNDRLWIGSLEDRSAFAVVDKFSKSNVYYAAAWDDCGCGWFKQTMGMSSSERMRSKTLTRTCLLQLRQLLHRLLESEQTVELFLTWEGDQSKPAQRRLFKTPDQLGEDELALQLGDLVIVSLEPPS